MLKKFQSYYNKNKRKIYCNSKKRKKLKKVIISDLLINKKYQATEKNKVKIKIKLMFLLMLLKKE
jgi:hypothetical protein